MPCSAGGFGIAEVRTHDAGAASRWTCPDPAEFPHACVGTRGEGGLSRTKGGRRVQRHLEGAQEVSLSPRNEHSNGAQVHLRMDRMANVRTTLNHVSTPGRVCCCQD